MTTKTKIYVFGSIGLVVIGTIIYIVTKPKAVERLSDGTPIPKDDKGKPTANTGNDNFPLKLGSKGKRVQELNLALGLVPTDEFTAQTQITLKEKHGVTQVTQAQWNLIAPYIEPYL